jgi:hypothetical protein
MALVVSFVLVLLGVFWAGRESSHGLTAFWEHWWCPIPLVMVLVGVLLGVAATISTRRRSFVA